MDRIKGYFSYSNVDSVVQGCNILADTGAEYAYCCEKKTVNYYSEGKKAEGLFTCNELLNQNFTESIKVLDCKEVIC